MPVMEGEEAALGRTLLQLADEFGYPDTRSPEGRGQGINGHI
jgi:hypothetical protein